MGNLKEAAKRPGPGAYEIPSRAFDPNCGQVWGTAKRTLTTDAAATKAYRDTISKEQLNSYRGLPDMGSDALDELLREERLAAVPRPAPVAPMSHQTFLKQLDSIPRLLRGNVFGGGAYDISRQKYNRSTLMADMHQQPWAEGRRVAPIDRKNYHFPNEFSEQIDAASRMGLTLYGIKKH
uniref:Uncharacterized protein n=1 Tax=Haptolina brevifila TaxID=156173 RepID=A0A7S2IQ53_9EUKA